jgi:hypothetical protein
MQNNLNTSNPNNYIYETKYLKIQVLGGIRFNNLEAMRVTRNPKTRQRASFKAEYRFV